MMSTPSASASASTANLPEYEVEQKFTIQSTKEIETRLKQLGFAKQPKEIHMVDWYWDSSGINGDWKLTTQDCWLRFRHKLGESDNNNDNDKSTTAMWQLKVRRQVEGNAAAAAAATVYEEIGGSKALSTAMSLLLTTTTSPTIEDNNRQSTATTASEDDDDGKELKDQKKLLDQFVTETRQTIPDEIMPFARIETKRSSWIPSSTSTTSSAPQTPIPPELYANLKVDLDMAIYGGPEEPIYTVGEVEEVVNKEEDIPLAKQRVEEFIPLLLRTTTTEPEPDLDASAKEKKKKQNKKTPEGKLEHYLIQHRPKHYLALVDSGILLK